MLFLKLPVSQTTLSAGAAAAASAAADDDDDDCDGRDHNVRVYVSVV